MIDDDDVVGGRRKESRVVKFYIPVPTLGSFSHESERFYFTLPLSSRESSFTL